MPTPMALLLFSVLDWSYSFHRSVFERFIMVTLIAVVVLLLMSVLVLGLMFQSKEMLYLGGVVIIGSFLFGMCADDGMETTEEIIERHEKAGTFNKD